MALRAFCRFPRGGREGRAQHSNVRKRVGYFPGEPQAGAVSERRGRTAECWTSGKTAAKNIDFISPDIYVADYPAKLKQFHRNGNPIFVPEACALWLGDNMKRAGEGVLYDRRIWRDRVFAVCHKPPHICKIAPAFERLQKSLKISRARYRRRRQEKICAGLCRLPKSRTLWILAT